MKKFSKYRYFSEVKWAEAFIEGELRQKIITERLYLMEGHEVPDAFTDFLKHAALSKAILKKWGKKPEDHYKEHEAVAAIP